MRSCTFFAYGAISAFQAYLNPLSEKEHHGVCVMPVLLYKCENWLLTLNKLESFQAELGRRILRLSISILFMLSDWP